MQQLNEFEANLVSGGTDTYGYWQEELEYTWNELLRRLEWEKTRQA